jgi:hypothetical protein
MSSTRFWRHGGFGVVVAQEATPVRSTPWTSKTCGPPVRPPLLKKIGAPPGVAASWKLVVVRPVTK